MHFLPTRALVLAMISCGLLSTTLAAPTAQLLTMGAEEGQSDGQTRQCANYRCSGPADDRDQTTAAAAAPSMTRQIWSWVKGSHGQGSPAFNNMQTRQIFPSGHDNFGLDSGDVERRQVMHALGAEAGETRSRRRHRRQVHSGFAAESGQDVVGRQIMHSSSLASGANDDGVVSVESRQARLALVGELEEEEEEEGDVRARQIMHSSSADDGAAGSVERRQVSALGGEQLEREEEEEEEEAEGDVRARQIMHSSSSADDGAGHVQVRQPTAEEWEVLIRQLGMPSGGAAAKGNGEAAEAAEGQH